MLSDKEIKVLNLIAEDKSLENYFFNRVSHIKWFLPLKEKGYFNPENAPGPQPTDEEGYVRIPVWNVLPYLEKVSQQVKEPGNEMYIDELLNIIRDVTRYHVKNNRCLDNYHTWTSFVRILCNLPSEKISLKDIRLIKFWLDSKYPSSLLGSEIALKLLPKFLSGKTTTEDIKKAEVLFAILFEIKWKNRRSIKKEPFLLIGQNWLVESLINKRYAQKIGKLCSDKPVYILAEKLKAIFRKEKNPMYFDVTVAQKSYRISVNHTKDFEFKINGGLINQEERSKVESSKPFLRKKLYIPEKQFEFTLSDCENVESFSSCIISQLRWENTIDVKNQLERIYNEIYNDFSYIWYSNIAEVPHYIPTDVKQLLVFIMREVLTAKIQKSKEFGFNIIEEFFSVDYQYPVFKRIALYIINKHWVNYYKKFEELVESGELELLLNEAYYKVEIYDLIEKHINDICKKMKEKIEEIIEKGPQKPLPEENEEEYVVFWKLRWYSAMKSDERFGKIYKHYLKKANIEKYDFRKEWQIQTRVGPGKSPLSIEQILSMSNEDLAKFLSAFKTRDLWEGPTVEGLAETLKNAAKTEPMKFIENLDPFTDTSYLYIFYMLWGIRESWDDKKHFDWGKLLTFLKNYINRKEFWKDELPTMGDRWQPNHAHIISSIGTLIQDGTRDDAWAFEEKYNSLAIEIFSIILTDVHIKKLNKKFGKDDFDYIMAMHNTPLGNIIIALIYLSLRIVRLWDKKRKSNKKWNVKLKKLYEKTFDHNVTEAYTVLGQYLPNIMYLDKDWVEGKVRELEQPEQEKFRRAFMAGYLYNQPVYDNIYQLESMQSHYRWALNTTWDEHLRAKLVSHIAIGYLRGYDDLFNLLLKKWKPSQILDLINFFWQKSEDLLKNRDELISRILYFWCKVYEKYRKKRKLSDDDKKILSNVVKLTFYLECIDKEKFEWLMLSAPYVHVDYNERWFIEYLDNLKDKGKDKVTTIKYILSIIHEMLKNYVFPFARDNMKSIISYAYKLAQDEGDSEIKDLSNQICNILGAAGYDYLRELYEENNQ